MSILVFVEGADNEIKKSSKEAISYAAETAKLTGAGAVIAVVFGTHDEGSLAVLGTHGVDKVIHVEEEPLNQNHISAFGDVLTNLAESHDAAMIIMVKSAFSDNVGARVAGKIGAAIISNVVSLPVTSGDFTVKKSIFTGKAFATVKVTGEKKVLIIKKNTVDLKEDGANAPVEKISAPVELKLTETITGKDKAEGGILLDEAEIVVSGGRGLKGPENWGIIEDLAAALGAATGCSKPVSDMGWRPHHEHVGQTGVKVSPNLYIAVGISGAIQHLAGVNSSKVLVAINNDPEAPFFKAADYGIIGDAFEVVPKLTEKIKSLK